MRPYIFHRRAGWTWDIRPAWPDAALQLSQVRTRRRKPSLTRLCREGGRGVERLPALATGYHPIASGSDLASPSACPPVFQAAGIDRHHADRAALRMVGDSPSPTAARDAAAQQFNALMVAQFQADRPHKLHYHHRRMDAILARQCRSRLHP